MCNDYYRYVAYQRIRHRLVELGIDLAYPEPHRAPNLEPQPDIRPSNLAQIVRRRPDTAIEMVPLRWGLVPWFHNGAVKDWTKKFATFNAKGEDLATKRTWKGPFAARRCLIPADGWYEFKGAKSPKDKFAFKRRDGDIVFFAGLWDRADTLDGRIESFTMVTQAPGPAMIPWHHRAPVVLRPEEWSRWLDLDADVSPILMRASEDLFDVEQVR